MVLGGAGGSARNNYGHGLDFEATIIKAFAPGAEGHVRRYGDPWDLPATDDPELGIPTSIKTTGKGTIYFGDAIRFMSINQKFRLIVGQWSQEGDIKCFEVLWEFVLTPEELRAKIFVSLDLEVVRALDQDIKHTHGDHMSRKRLARMRNKVIRQENPLSLLQLNPKIDSEGQRRLQCSVKLKQLLATFDPVVYRKDFHGLKLPYRVPSGPRPRRKKADRPH